MLDRRVLPILAICLPFVAAALWSYVLLPTTAWMTEFDWLVLLGLFGLAIATPIAIVARARWLGIAIPAALLAMYAAVAAATLFGVELIPMNGFASDKYAVALSAGMALAVGGLVLRRPWAYSLALALGITGIGCGTLNAIQAWDLGPPELVEFYERYRLAFFYLVSAIGGALIVVNLVAARASFATSADRPDPLVRWLRLAIGASFVAVPMLLVYAWLQPVAPATQTPALVLAAAFAIGAILAVRGKLVGALLLVVAGFGLAGQTIATLALAETARHAYYYAAFWTPAALSAIACGVVLARPTLRLLRR